MTIEAVGFKVFEDNLPQDERVSVALRFCYATSLLLLKHSKLNLKEVCIVSTAQAMCKEALRGQGMNEAEMELQIKTEFCDIMHSSSGIVH